MLVASSSIAAAQQLLGYAAICVILCSTIRSFAFSSPLIPPHTAIVDLVCGSDDFSALCDALVATDLVDTLLGAAPFTVFAPTDDAFDDLDKREASDLLDVCDFLDDADFSDRTDFLDVADFRD